MRILFVVINFIEKIGEGGGLSRLVMNTSDDEYTLKSSSVYVIAPNCIKLWDGEAVLCVE